MTQHGQEAVRWENYHLTRGVATSGFWSEHLASTPREVILITSKSFDPRTQLVPQMLRTAGGEGRRDCAILVYEEPDGEKSLMQSAQENLESIQTLSHDRGRVILKSLQMRSPEGRRVGPRLAANLFSNAAEFSPYTDIVIDITGMPRGIFFPLVARILFLLDEEKPRKNCFILVAEDSGADAAIQALGVEEMASYIPSFSGSFNRESQTSLPRIWFPILGENRLVQLERIHDLIKPTEICPVLPSPSQNPRRSDNLVAEHREFLFGQLELDPRSFMSVAESNPFEVYRCLRQAVLRYQRVLSDLGGCQIAFSVLSSKLTSLGAFLAAYELATLGIEVAVAHVDSQSYQVGNYTPRSEVVGLWVTGECYED